MYRRAIAACALALAVCFSMAEAQSLPPIEAFGNLPFASHPVLSPDGQHFALIQSLSGRPAAAIYATNPQAEDKPVYVGSPGGLIDGLFWAKNDRLIIVGKQGIAMAQDRLRTWRRAFSVDIHGGKLATLMANVPALGNNVDAVNVIDLAPEDPDNIYMALWNIKPKLQEDLNTLIKKKQDDTFKYDLFKVDVHSGKAMLVQSGNETTIDWISDGHGKAVARIDQTERPLKDHVWISKGGHWEEIGIYDASADHGSGVVGLNAEGSALVRIVGMSDGEERPPFYGLVSHDLANGSEKPLFSVPGFDMGATRVDPWTRRVIGATFISDIYETSYFDAQDQALQTGLKMAFPGLAVDIVSWNLSKTKVIFSVDGPRQPTGYFLLDRTTHQTQFLASGYPALQDKDLGEMKPYAYKARDGLDIAAYITLPPGKSAKNLPVVVMPHGGPDRRDYIRFDWMAQFLANRGYVVLQPNFRGSSGYGRKFTEAGLQQWGLKMQDDITDGVKKLIADGIADPKRICIVGGSYGGYAALAGATFTPDLYACSVAIAPVSDLPAQLGAETLGSGGHSQLASFWFSRMGEDTAKMAAVSPARHADKVKAPILLLHGVNDTTVRLEQSKLEAEALKTAGKQVELITFEGEDHYLELASTRIQVLKEMERFLKQHIGN